MLTIDDNPYRFLVYVVVGCVLLFGILSYWYWTMPMEMMAKSGNYIQLVTVVLLLISGAVTLMNFKMQIDDHKHTTKLQYANVTENEINDIDKLFMSNSLLDRLYFEMYAHTQQVQKILQMRDPIIETPEMLKMEQHMSSIIFQKIADVYFCEELDHSDLKDSMEWIVPFRYWLKSPILRSHWQYLKYEHHPEVRHFVETTLMVSK